MIPKVYVAGASVELARCRTAIDSLSAAGITVTHDWTEPVRKYGSAGVELKPQQRAMYARLNLDGIQEANVFWLLAPSAECTGTGMWIELGYALALPFERGRKIVVSPPISHRNVFACLPRVREHESDQAVLDWLLSLT